MKIPKRQIRVGQALYEVTDARDKDVVEIKEWADAIRARCPGQDSIRLNRSEMQTMIRLLSQVLRINESEVATNLFPKDIRDTAVFLAQVAADWNASSSAKWFDELNWQSRSIQ